MPENAPSRRLDILLVAFVFLLVAYFHNGQNWNQTARLDPVWSFVEPGPHQYTFRIDDFIFGTNENTGDWARNKEHDPHYYSNKAPGSILLGVPPYFVLYHTERALGIDPAAVAPALFNIYLLNLLLTALPLALSAPFFLRLMLRLTAGDQGRSMGLTLLLYAGTLMWPFSTQLWGHPTAAAFVVIAFERFLAASKKGAFVCGFFLGLAVLTDYAAAPLAVAVTIALAAAKTRRQELGPLILGALGPALAFALYHRWCFGSFLTLSSSHSNPMFIEQGKVGGLFQLVSGEALWGLTFSLHRGFFVYCPVFLLLPVAVWRIRGSAHPLFYSLALGNALLLLLLNASFNGWDGGLCTGPRYLILALPGLVALLALLPKTRGVRIALPVLALASALNMGAIAAVSPMAPDRQGSPLLFCYGQLKRAAVDERKGVFHYRARRLLVPGGDLQVYTTFLVRPWRIHPLAPERLGNASFNLGGKLLGLPGIWSLLPFLLIEGALLFVLLRGSRGPPTPASSVEAEAAEKLTGEAGSEVSGGRD